jgi:hypothetical protein
MEKMDVRALMQENRALFNINSNEQYDWIMNEVLSPFFTFKMKICFCNKQRKQIPLYMYLGMCYTTCMSFFEILIAAHVCSFLNDIV